MMKPLAENSHPPDSVFQEYLDGELNTLQITELEVHLEFCHECTAQLTFWQTTFQRIGSLPDARMERSLTRAVLDQISPARDTASPFHLILAEAGLGTAMAFALWPFISSWLKEAASTLSTFLQIGIGRSHAIFAAMSFPENGFNTGRFTLPAPLTLSDNSLLILAVSAVLLFLFGNKLILKTTKPKHQRR